MPHHISLSSRSQISLSFDGFFVSKHSTFSLLPFALQLQPKKFLHAHLDSLLALSITTCRNGTAALFRTSLVLYRPIDCLLPMPLSKAFQIFYFPCYHLKYISNIIDAILQNKPTLFPLLTNIFALLSNAQVATDAPTDKPSVSSQLSNKHLARVAEQVDNRFYPDWMGANKGTLQFFYLLFSFHPFFFSQRLVPLCSY